MKSTPREILAKKMADRIGHGMEEKCYTHADVAIEFVSDYSFTSTLSLMEAYRKAENNEECAKILRLYCTDFMQYCREYDPGRLRVIRECKELYNEKQSDN